MQFLIRRYDNRKFYLVNEGRYVNRKVILTLFKDDFDVKIIEHGSENDVTKEVLNKFLAEYSPMSIKEMRAFIKTHEEEILGTKPAMSIGKGAGKKLYAYRSKDSGEIKLFPRTMRQPGLARAPEYDME